MSPKKLIWFGAVVGSTIGGMVPQLWHAGMFSMWGMVLSTVGAVAGIWVGWRMTQ